MAEYTEKEKLALEKLRSALGKTKLPYDHDCYLIKWLRARNMSVTKAEDMLRKHLKWREENKVDEIAATYERCEILKKYHSLTRLGDDKEGNILFLQRMGSFDIKGLLLSVGHQNLARFDIALGENCLKEYIEKTLKFGKPVGIYVLHDVSQMSVTDWLNKTVFEWMNYSSAVQSENYPESLHKIVCINCSKTFYTLFNAVKRFIPKETTNKIAIFEKNGWQDYLLQDIDACQLPECYGGTMSEDDPRLACLAGKIPEELYLTNRLSVMVSNGEVKKHVVHRRSTVDAEAVTVTKAGSVLRFIVCIDSMDILFQVIYCKDESNETIVRDSEKLTSANVFSRFDLTCLNPGKYILRLDNSYSILNSKEVFYKIEVLE